jgi:hypothetical protein
VYGFTSSRKGVEAKKWPVGVFVRCASCQPAVGILIHLRNAIGGDDIVIQT